MHTFIRCKWPNPRPFYQPHQHLLRSSDTTLECIFTAFLLHRVPSSVSQELETWDHAFKFSSWTSKRPSAFLQSRSATWFFSCLLSTRRTIQASERLHALPGYASFLCFFTVYGFTAFLVRQLFCFLYFSYFQLLLYKISASFRNALPAIPLSASTLPVVWPLTPASLAEGGMLV